MPFSAVLAESDNFIMALAEARQNNQDESVRPAIGAPWISFFHIVVTAMLEADIGGINKSGLKEWLDMVNNMPSESRDQLGMQKLYHTLAKFI